MQASCTKNIKVSSRVFWPINLVHIYTRQIGGILCSPPPLPPPSQCPTQDGLSLSILVMTTYLTFPTTCSISVYRCKELAHGQHVLMNFVLKHFLHSHTLTCTSDTHDRCYGIQVKLRKLNLFNKEICLRCSNEYTLQKKKHFVRVYHVRIFVWICKTYIC